MKITRFNRFIFLATDGDEKQPDTTDAGLPIREPGQNGYPVGGERQPVPQV